MNSILRVGALCIAMAMLMNDAGGEPPAGKSSGPATAKRTALILCTGNSARSQMAEGLLRHYAGDRFLVLSAGTKPADRVNPFAIRALAELGIDISQQTPKHMDQFIGRQPIDFVIAVCSSADSECPAVLPGVANRLSWPFDDPAAIAGTDEEKIAGFRRIRDQIREKIQKWLAESQQ